MTLTTKCSRQSPEFTGKELSKVADKQEAAQGGGETGLGATV